MDATMQPAEAFVWLTAYDQFLEGAARFYEGIDGLPYESNPAAAAVTADALWSAVIQGLEESSPEAIREIARMSSTDRLAKADELMRVVGLHRRKRKTGLENLTKAEAIIAGLVQRFGPLPGSNSGPHAGSAPPTATR
jgi:hypothetical protein